MSWFSSDPSIRLRGSQYEITCDLRLPGRTKRCSEIIREYTEKDVKRLWEKHKKWHKDQAKKKVNELRNRYSDRVAELLEEYESIDKVPTNKIKGLHTKGIPNVPDGQNVNGLVYDKEGRRVPFEVLKKYVQGWDD